MTGACKFIASMTLGTALCHISACATLQPTSSYNPDELWKLTSCAMPLILRHKTKADISALDKVKRLTAVGLSLYDGSSKGTNLSGREIIYSDEITKGEACEQQDITIHYVTNFNDFKDYADAKRDIRPIYVRHLKSTDIRRDKSIHCEGVFNYYYELERSGIITFMPTYNEELCGAHEQ